MDTSKIKIFNLVLLGLLISGILLVGIYITLYGFVVASYGLPIILVIMNIVYYVLPQQFKVQKAKIIQVLAYLTALVVLIIELITLFYMIAGKVDYNYVWVWILLLLFTIDASLHALSFAFLIYREAKEVGTVAA